jgi:hypothetical protein
MVHKTKISYETKDFVECNSWDTEKREIHLQLDHIIVNHIFKSYRKKYCVS